MFLHMLCVSMWAFVPVADVTEESGSSYIVCMYCMVWVSVCVIQHQAVAELSLCAGASGEILCV